MLSESILRVGDSTTMAFAAKAMELKKINPNLIDLTVGEPDFPTPDNIKQAAIEAINNNKTKYTFNQGLFELRLAFCEYLEKRFSLSYLPDQIIVSTGAKQGIFNAVQILVGDGDEVIIPAPYYPSHVQMVNFAGGTPVIVETNEENNFKITPEHLQKALTHKTKLLVLCNPGNPTGTVYTKEELSEIGKFVLENNLYVISDEIYEQLIYDELQFTSFASLNEELKERTIIANGVSKTYSMTGWRIGLTASNSEFAKAMSKLQSHTTSNANTIAQYASVDAFKGNQASVLEMKKEFERRRNLTYDVLTQIPGIKCSKPKGAFYVFPNIKAFLGKEYMGKIISGSTDLAYYLLEEAETAVVPGKGFGMENYIRISYSTNEINLRNAAERIKTALAKLR